MRPARTAAVLLAVLALAACAERTPGPLRADIPPRVQLPTGPDDLVLRIEFVGGFTTPRELASRLPVISVHGDGRAILQGPVAAIYPGFAWPNVSVLHLGRDELQELADRAVAAGVTESGDLGPSLLADVPSTRFTLVTAEGTYVREVEALARSPRMPTAGLTDDQVAARQRLEALLTQVGDLVSAERPEDVPRSWTPASVAAVVEPWTAPEEDVALGLAPPPVPWPGPELPGEPVGPGTGCVVATGEVAAAVIAAAGGANSLTPWATPEGSLWSVSFRPLLPDETGCADLLG